MDESDGELSWRSMIRNWVRQNIPKERTHRSHSERTGPRRKDELDMAHDYMYYWKG
jgi:hypothetical protein